MRWQYTGPGGDSLDSKPPATATEVDREYILFALTMFRENSELVYSVTLTLYLTPPAYIRERREKNVVLHD